MKKVSNWKSAGKLSAVVAKEPTLRAQVKAVCAVEAVSPPPKRAHTDSPVTETSSPMCGGCEVSASPPSPPLLPASAGSTPSSSCALCSPSSSLPSVASWSCSQPECLITSVCAMHSIVHGLQSGHKLLPISAEPSLCGLHPHLPCTHVCLSDGIDVCIQCIIDVHHGPSHSVVSAHEAGAGMSAALARLKARGTRELEAAATTQAKIQDAQTEVVSAAASAKDAVLREVDLFKCRLDGAAQTACEAVQATASHRLAQLRELQTTSSEFVSQLSADLASCFAAVTASDLAGLSTCVEAVERSIVKCSTITVPPAIVLDVSTNAKAFTASLQGLFVVKGASPSPTSSASPPAPPGVIDILAAPANPVKVKQRKRKATDGPSAAIPAVTSLPPPASLPLLTPPPPPVPVPVLIPVIHGTAGAVSTASVIIHPPSAPAVALTPLLSIPVAAGVRYGLAVSDDAAWMAVAVSSTDAAPATPGMDVVYVYCLPEGNLSHTVGKYGKAGGELRQPRRITFVANTTNLLIADSGNSRVQELTLKGDVVNVFRVVRAAFGLACSTTTVAASCGEFVLRDWTEKAGFAITLFSYSTTEVLATIRHNSLCQFQFEGFCNSLTFSPDGAVLYAVDGRSDQVLVFNSSNGSFIRSLPLPPCERLINTHYRALTTFPDGTVGTVLTPHTASTQCVTRLDCSRGDGSAAIVSLSDVAADVQNPIAITAHSSGRLFAMDRKLPRVCVYTLAV